MIKKIVLLLLFILPAISHSESFVIKDYQVDMAIRKNGTMRVTEKILVDFSESRRGIYRIIPIRSYVNGEWETIRINGIRSDEPKKVIRNKSSLKIRFGKSDVWLPEGEKLYEFSYVVDKVMLTGNTNYDELYWNAIGTMWEVPIYKTTIKVSFPEGMKLQENMEYRLYIGKEGNTTEYHDYEMREWEQEKQTESYEHLRKSRFMQVESGYGLSQDISGNDLIIQHNKKLRPKEGITLQIRLKKGFIKITAWQVFLDFFYRWFHILIVGIWMLVSLIIWYKYGKDEKVHVMVEYFPPQVSPAEAASILKQRSAFNLSATIVDLARRGYLVIGEDEDGQKYVERLLTTNRGLKSYEKMLMTKLFKDAYTSTAHPDRVYTDSLSNVFFTDYNTVNTEFEKVFDQKGYFKKAGNKWRGFYITLIVFAIIAMFISLFVFDNPRRFLIFLLLSIVNNAIFAGIMPQKSEKGLAEYRSILGFKEFIRRAEKDKIMRLFNENRKYFDETIAYAMAFGLAGKWSRMFNNLMLEPPEWYRGYSYTGSYRASSFLYAINAFNRDISSNATSQPSSSGSSSYSGGSSWSGGGGSWGGSSGGGFGGGGGGSW